MSINFEKLFLLFFFAAALFIGMSNIFDNSLSHEFPYAFMASDPFIHYLATDSLKEGGNFFHVQTWWTAGYDDVEYCMPPQNYMMAAAFSYNSGLESYDSIYFISILAAILNALIVYLMLRKISKNAAIISLPFSLIVFTKVFITSFTWGQWQAAVAYMFFTAALWALSEINSKKMFILFAIFASACFMTHYPEFIFLAFFMVLYAAIKFFTKDLKKDEIKNLALAALLILILTFWEILRFYGIWIKEGGDSLGSPTLSIANGIPVPSIFDFTIFVLVLMAIGIIFSLMMLKKQRDVIILYAFFILIMWWSNYLGLTKRTITLRDSAPVVLAVFAGIGIYYLLKMFVKEWKLIYSIGIGVITTFAIIMFFMSPQGSNGWMIKERWDAMKFIRDTTPQDSKVLYFYGDGYEQQNPLVSIKRFTYRLLTDSMIEGLQNNSINRHYIARDVTGICSVSEPYRISLLDYGFHGRELTNISAHQDVDICSFNYYFVETASGRAPQLAQYNVEIANELLKHDWIKVVYSNRLDTVLQNTRPGVNCIGNQTQG